MTGVPDPDLPAAEAGTGRPVVFLHGYPLNRAIFEPQLAALSGGHRIVLFDLPGYGQAEGRPVPETLGGFAEQVHATLVRRFPGPVAIVGHSFGGYIALQLLRDHPEKFDAVVLTNTRSGPDTPEARAKRLATVARLADPSEGLDIEQTARSLLAPATWQAGGSLPILVRRIVRGARSAAIIATLKAIADRPDSTPVLAGIRVPTLVIWGEADQLIPPAESRSMLSQIPRSVGIGVPGAGHLPSLEAPRAFNHAIAEFLAGRPPSGSR